jgi:hypothetical protein
MFEHGLDERGELDLGARGVRFGKDGVDLAQGEGSVELRCIPEEYREMKGMPSTSCISSWQARAPEMDGRKEGRTFEAYMKL